MEHRDTLTLGTLVILGTILFLLFQLHEPPALNLQKVKLFLGLSIFIKIGWSGDTRKIDEI
jgi:hypothetical protein